SSFSRRRRHTRSKRDWSSDVCSSDLAVWKFEDPGCLWPAVSRRQDEAAAWLHVPAVAGGPEAWVDPIDLSRDITSGAVERAQMEIGRASCREGEQDEEVDRCYVQTVK